MEKRKICSICHTVTENPDAPILTIGGFGTPRYLCDSCASDIDIATLGKDYESIVAAMDRIGSEMSKKGTDDPVTLECLEDMLTDAAKRATAIKDGSYDFALDEVSDDENELDEIPEELLESEEDKALDEAEEASAKKIDKVMNWIWLVVLVGAVGFMIWWLFFR